MKWVPYVVVLLLVLGVYHVTGSHVFEDEYAERVMIKKTRSNTNSVIRVDSVKKNKSKKNRSAASEPTPIVPPPQLLVMENPLNLTENPFLENTKGRVEKEKNILNSISREKRERLDIQLVGNGEWSIFSDLQVSKDPTHNALFAFGPYHVSRKEDGLPGNSMRLVIEENQKFLGVLTGRIVIKVRELYDMEPLMKEYGLKVDSVSAEIRTAYVDASDVAGFSRLSQTLKADQRIERFYFEVVKTDWVKN